MEKIDVSEKAFVDILFALDDGAKSFNDLKKLGFSPSTVLSRLREAQEKSLIEEKLIPQKNKRSQIKYVLTNNGEKVLDTYLPVKNEYLILKKELIELEREIKTKERNMKYLLSSASKPK